MHLFPKLFICIALIFNSIQAYDYSGKNFCIIYHGSSKDFSQVKPSYNEKKDFQEQGCWKGTAIFGSHDYRIALFYTYNKAVERIYGCKIVLKDRVSSTEPIVYYIYGGSGQEDALSRLYGDYSDETTGHIYILDGRYFYREKGLGNMEGITTNPKAQIGKVGINRRKEIANMVEKGLVEIKWSSHFH